MRKEQVDVITAHEILGHSNDGACQALLSTMICWVLWHITWKLCNLWTKIQQLEVLKPCQIWAPMRLTGTVHDYLSLCHKKILESTEQNLPLAWLQPIHHSGNWTWQISHGKQNQLSVHKVAILDNFHSLIQKCPWLQTGRISIKHGFYNNFQTSTYSWRKHYFIVSQTGFSSLHFLLVECHLNCITIILTFPMNILFVLW